MSAHWHIGMEVECIDASPGYVPGSGHLVLGKVYEIIGFDAEDADAPPNLYLKGMPMIMVPGWKEPIGWRPSRFRPVQKRETSISIFQAILLNPHVKIKEPA